MNKRITFIGMGPGAKEYLTLEALSVLRASQTVLASTRLYELIKDENPKARFIELPNHSLEASTVIQRLEENGLTILVSGDTGLFSMAQSLKKLLPEASFRFVSGISSVQLAFARLGEDWSQNRVYSLHGRELKVDSTYLKNENVFTLLCGTREGQNKAQEIYDEIYSSFNAWAFIDLSLTTEKMISMNQLNLKEAPVFSRLLLVFIKRSQS